MKLTQKKASSTHRVCVFGASKTGKTELVGKLAEKYNLLWFDLENGHNTLLKLPVEWQERIEIVDLPDTRSYPIAIETMLKVLTGNKTKICDTHGKVNCALCSKNPEATHTEVCLSELDESWIVVIDSGTQLANSAMAHITKNQDDDYKYDWDDYRKQGTVMDKALSYIQQAKYNVVFITHEAEVEMEDGKTKLVPVAGTTNFSRNTAKYFDHVVRCEVKNRKHAFGSSTTFSANALTGSRTNQSIETQKEGEQSLLPFFDGSVPIISSGPVESGTTSINRLAALRAKNSS